VWLCVVRPDTPGALASSTASANPGATARNATTKSSAQVTPRVERETKRNVTQLAGVVENARSNDGITTSTWIASTRPL
jgi:hypothetical protein